MEHAGIHSGLRHCCATGGSLVHPEYRLDMVRLGMLPLGMSYSDESVEALGLRPAMTWKTFISQIEHIELGESVSYGCIFRADKSTIIGIATCGYADGYRRSYSNKTSFWSAAKRYPF